jgi:PAS domain S-box-containing protein
MTGINWDVTEAHALISDRARQHDLLRLSEQRFRLLVEGIPDHAFYALDTAGMVNSWNKGAERLKGYRAEEIIGEHFSRFFTSEDLAIKHPSHVLSEAARIGEYVTEGWRVRKDGSRFWAGVTIHALRDPIDGLIGFAKITRDLTDRIAQEEHRRLIVEAAPNGMLLVDEWGYITFANSAAEKIFGYAQGVLVGCSVGLLVPNASPDQHPALRLDLGSVASSKVYARRSDGTEFPVEIGLNPIVSSAGRVVVASVVDITQRTVQEAALERSRTLLEQTGRISGVGGWELEIGAQAVIWSAQTCRILDVEPGHTPSLAEALAFYTPDSRTILEGAIAKGMEQGEGWDLELSVITAKGRSILVRALGAVEFKDGTPVRLFGAFQDVTEIKRAQLELVETSTRLRNVLTSASEVAIIVTDPKLLITVFNRGAEKLLGYAGAEVIGRATPALFHDDDEIRARGEELSAQLGYPVEGRGVFTEPSTLQQPREWTYVCKDGRRVQVSLVVTAVRSDGGDLLGYLGMAHDVTRENEVEEKLRVATTLAEKANLAKSAFLASMSHEIRTPMNGVIGFAALLLDSELTDQQRSHMTRLQEAAKSLLSLMNDILDLSKIEAGKLKVEAIPMNPMSVVHGAVSVVRTQMASKGLDVRFEIAPDVPVWIESDPTRLRQILLNLLSNALKFTDNGSIAVRCSRESVEDDERLRFEVEDTGIGIPADRQHLLFQNFSQIDSSTTRRYGGTGLGLSICKQLAQVLGGEIGVSSLPGAGSTIWFTIALHSCPAPDLSIAHVPAIIAATPARILVADDLQMNRDIIEMMLRRAGHSVQVVENGRQAIIAVQESDFDIVLMDMEMPEVDGIEATRAIRHLDERVRHIPIVALTANAFLEDQRRCHEAGMNDFLPKPIDRDALLAVVTKWSAGIPCEEPATAHTMPPVLDLAVLDAFDSTFGAEETARFSAKFQKEVRDVLAAMTSAMETAFIAREAHKIVNLAGNLGCVELAGFARNLCSEAKRENCIIDGMLIELPATIDRAVAALADRYQSIDIALNARR